MTDDTPTFDRCPTCGGPCVTEEDYDPAGAGTHHLQYTALVDRPASEDDGLSYRALANLYVDTLWERITLERLVNAGSPYPESDVDPALVARLVLHDQRVIAQSDITAQRDRYQRQAAWQRRQMSLLRDDLRQVPGAFPISIAERLETTIHGAPPGPNPIRVHRDRDFGDEREDGE